MYLKWRLTAKFWVNDHQIATGDGKSTQQFFFWQPSLKAWLAKWQFQFRLIQQASHIRLYFGKLVTKLATTSYYRPILCFPRFFAYHARKHLVSDFDLGRVVRLPLLSKRVSNPFCLSSRIAQHTALTSTSLLSTERVQGSRVAQVSSSNSCATPSRVASASNRRTYCAAPVKAVKPSREHNVIVYVEQRAGETYLLCKDVPSALPVKRCEAPRAPTKVRCAPICPVARLPVRAQRGVCPEPPKKVWVAVPVFADETIAFPRLEAFVEAKTSLSAEDSTGVNVVAPKKSCLRRLNAEPRRVHVTWSLDEVREFRFSASVVEGTTPSTPEKELDSSIVASSSASHATASSSGAVESVNGIVENDFGALMALANCAVAALEAMEEVTIVAVHLALPQPDVAVAPRRKLRPNPIMVRDARMATLRPRPFDRARRRACVAMAFVDRV